MTNTLALVEPDRAYSITVDSRRLEQLLKARTMSATGHCVAALLTGLGFQPDEATVRVDNESLTVHLHEVDRTLTIQPHVGLRA